MIGLEDRINTEFIDGLGPERYAGFGIQHPSCVSASHYFVQALMLWLLRLLFRRIRGDLRLICGGASLMWMWEGFAEGVVGLGCW